MIRKKLLILILAVAAFALGLVASLKSETPGSGFDSKLRDEFFAGFAGDSKSLDSAMKRAEDALAANSKDADAMVWHGTGVFFKAGQAFQGGDMETGMDLYRKGLSEMDKAVQVEPDNIGVRSLRGGMLLQATLHMEGNPETGQLVELALSDYEHLYQLQQSGLEKLSTHARGELLFGIADSNHRLGKDAKAKEWFQRISAEMKGSSYQKRADIFLQTGSLTVEQSTCEGCHTR
jgi:tetratricopeptide (TPR) repeat protein